MAYFDNDNFDGCQKACQHNLADPTLSAYWKLKNILLFISASGDWDESEKWRVWAEDIYRAVLNKVRPDSSTTEQGALRELRESLDQVKGWQEEDLAEWKARKARAAEIRRARRQRKGEEVEEVEEVAEVAEKWSGEEEPEEQYGEQPEEKQDPAKNLQGESEAQPKPDPHAKYAGLIRHPSLALRNKPSKGLLESMRKGRDAAFAGEGSASKRGSLSDLRRAFEHGQSAKKHEGEQQWAL